MAPYLESVPDDETKPDPALLPNLIIATPIQTLLSFLTDDFETVSNQRAAKRRKIEIPSPELDFVDVKQCDIICKLSKQEHVPQIHFPIERENIQEFARVDISQCDHGQTDNYKLTIRRHLVGRGINEGQVIFDGIFSGGKNLPWLDINTISKFIFPLHPKLNPDRQGRVWTKIDLEFGHSHHLDSDYLSLKFTLRCNITRSLEWVQPRDDRQNRLSDAISACFPWSRTNDIEQSWSPQDFYTSVHVPSKDDVALEGLQPSKLDAELFPFQRRALKWLLGREGVQNVEQQKVELNPEGGCKKLPYSFHQELDAHGCPFYFSKLFRLVTRDLTPYRQLQDLRGGILSEEMGLGKTVETIALITAHERDMAAAESTAIYDMYSKEKLRPARGTLIITPRSILQQWISELNHHASGLKVMHYNGITHYRGKLSEQELMEELTSCDVVLTTYNVLGAEIHYTKPPPDRKLRTKKHPTIKSPLKQLSWWRVCLDEAQMVESGVSAAAQVAKLIPRVNAWAITGTPVRRDVVDLLGLLCFLRLEPYATLRYFWNDLITNHQADFRALFGTIALRHSKQYIRDELNLPGQQRFVITVPFTPIEQHYYKNMFDEMCQEVGVDKQGAPLSEDWDPDDAATVYSMRAWLSRLRQVVLHPEIGRNNRRALGARDGPLRTVDDVLDVMLEQSEVSIRTSQRGLLLSKLKRGQYYENSPRVQEALDVWTEVRNEVDVLVDQSRLQLSSEIAKIRASKSDVAFDDELGSSGDESEDSNRHEAETEVYKRLGVLRNRLRSILEVQHMAVFFQTDAYFQIKSNEELTKPDSDDFKRLQKLEEDGYELAKKIRREILKEIITKVKRLMRRISKQAASQSFAEIPEFPMCEPRGGIESHTILTKMNNLGASLDAQANQLDEWREATVQLLLRKLIDEDEGMEITGEEYDDSTKLQDEVYVLVQALRTVIEDRHDALTGQDNILIKNDTKLAERMAREGLGHHPEKLLELFKIRREIKPPADLGSLRGIVSQLRQITNALRIEAEKGSARAQNELYILDAERVKIQKQMTDQTRSVERLRQEVDNFTALMNTRLEFYRQMQQVSDVVAKLEVKRWADHDKLLKEEPKIVSRIATEKSTRRYLLLLKDESGDAEERAARRQCVICREQIEVGSLTVCGHQFCKDCMFQWFSAHRNCPTCKKKLTVEDLHDISYKPQEVKVAEDHNSLSNGTTSDPTGSTIYSEMSNSTLAKIQNVELGGPSFTTKVDIIARHIIWLRESDPGAKSIIFTQFKTFTEVLGQAFKTFRIGYASIDHKDGIERFKKDSALECFLFHGKAQSSGLNLVNANHVFLCEPLINTAIELQAIARVDRIGQHQKTSVYLYLIQDTVEQAIYDISVERRMQHIGRNTKSKARERPELLEGSIEDSNSLQLQQAPLGNLLSKDKSGGENVDKSDLWQCLFGSLERNTEGRGLIVGAEVTPNLRRELGAQAAARRMSVSARAEK